MDRSEHLYQYQTSVGYDNKRSSERGLGEVGYVVCSNGTSHKPIGQADRDNKSQSTCLLQDGLPPLHYQKVTENVSLTAKLGFVIHPTFARALLQLLHALGVMESGTRRFLAVSDTSGSLFSLLCEEVDAVAGVVVAGRETDGDRSWPSCIASYGQASGSERCVVRAGEGMKARGRGLDGDNIRDDIRVASSFLRRWKDTVEWHNIWPSSTQSFNDR